MHLISQTRNIHLIFLSPPPDPPMSWLQQYSCAELPLVRTGHMKMMSQAGNVAGGKRQILENEAGIHLLYNIITRPSTGILYKIQP